MKAGGGGGGVSHGNGSVNRGVTWVSEVLPWDRSQLGGRGGYPQ